MDISSPGTDIASPITPADISRRDGAFSSSGGGGAASASSTPSFSGTTRKRNGSAVSTPPTKKRKQLTADEFRQRGKLEETWRKYIGHWRRFFNWLRNSEHRDMCIPGHNLKTADVFKSVYVPVPIEVFDEYIAFYGHKDDNMLKSNSTLDSFWASLVWVYDNHQPRIVVDDNLKAR